jgi:hypothetical protein
MFAAGLLVTQLQALEEAGRRGDADLVQVAGRRAGQARSREVATGVVLGTPVAATATEPVPGPVRAPCWWPGAIPLLLMGSVLGLAFRLGGWRLEGVAFAPLVGFVVTCGVLAMLLVESVGALVPVRAVFHRRRLRSWLVRRMGRLGPVALRQLEDLLAAEVTRPGAQPGSWSGSWPGSWSGPFATAPVTSIYNLPAEQLLAQVGLVVGQVRVVDRRFAHVVNAFTGLDGVTSVLRQLQAWLAQGWQRQVRLASGWLSGVVAIVLVRSTDIADGRPAVFVCAALLFGGFAAELSRDLTAGAGRLKGGG